MEEKSLPEYKQKLDELYALISAVLKMDLHIPMELFSLDCNTVNQVGLQSIFQNISASCAKGLSKVIAKRLRCFMFHVETVRKNYVLFPHIA